MSLKFPPSLPMLRASATPRVTKCPGSMMLRSFESTSGPARLGTAIHQCCERIALGVPPQVGLTAMAHDVDTDELYRLAWSAAQLWDKCNQFFPEPQVEVELCEFLEIPHGEAAPGSSTDLELTGHADIISLPGDGSIRVADWKSGWREGDYGAQLKTYALLAHEKYAISSDVPIDRVIVSILWLREGSIDSETYTTEQLEAWQETLVQVGRDALHNTLRIGEQCHYCPVSNCPALQSKSELFLVPHDGSDHVSITPENAASLYFLAQALGKRVDDVKMALKQFVFASGPVPTNSGKSLDLRPTTRESIAFSEEVAQTLLTQISQPEMFGALEISKSKLLDAVRKNAPSGEKKAAAEKMMEDLRSMGAVSTSVSQSLALVKPTEELE